MYKIKKPCGNRVVIRVKEFEEKTKGGIIAVSNVGIKGAHQRANQIATVVQIGKDAWIDLGDGAPWAEVGDLVLVARHSGEYLPEGEGDPLLRTINDNDIIDVLEEE